MTCSSKSCEDKLRHRQIHSDDKLEACRVSYNNLLEDDLKVCVEKAIAALNKGKDSVVAYQLNDMLETINNKLR